MHFFTILYIKTNRYSEEKIAIGLLANFSDIPYFGYSTSKLNFALKSINSKTGKAIKRSLGLLENDVNKIIKGETNLSLFDFPYAKQILSKLTLKKRGILVYSDLVTLEHAVDFSKLYEKYIGEAWDLSKTQTVKIISFKTEFHKYITNKKFDSFTKKANLSPSTYPYIYSNLKVDLLRKTNAFTIFHSLDFSASPSVIQRNLTQFRLIVRSLTENAKLNGLSKGRYYLIYKSPKEDEALAILNKIIAEDNDFELIKMSEMKDKI